MNLGTSLEKKKEIINLDIMTQILCKHRMANCRICKDSNKSQREVVEKYGKSNKEIIEEASRRFYDGDFAKFRSLGDFIEEILEAKDTQHKEEMKEVVGGMPKKLGSLGCGDCDDYVEKE